MFEAIEHITYSEGLIVLEKVKKQMRKDSVFMISTPRDINSKYNKMHKSQWDYPVLKNTLGSIFSYVEILGQDWGTGEISDIDIINNDFYIAICRI
jgi:predicted SAM-dependent methyltransferase